MTYNVFSGTLNPTQSQLNQSINPYNGCETVAVAVTSIVYSYYSKQSTMDVEATTLKEPMFV